MISVAFLAILGAPVEEALYPGRYGEIILTTKAASTASLVLLDAGDRLKEGAGAIAETSVAPLLAHAARALPTAFQAPLPSVATTMLAPATGVMLLTINGVTVSDLAELPQLSKLVSAGLQIPLEDSFAPRDHVAAATSRVTGTTPSDHGIPGKSWINATTGQIVSAFTPGSDELSPRVAGVADVVGQVSGGRALLLSMSGDPQLAAACGTCALSPPHPFSAPCMSRSCSGHRHPQLTRADSSPCWLVLATRRAPCAHARHWRQLACRLRGRGRRPGHGYPSR